MAELVVRNRGNAVKARLQRRARRNGRSMEDEIREILRRAAAEETLPTGGLGTEIGGLFAKAGLDADIPELRRYAVKPFGYESRPLQQTTEKLVSAAKCVTSAAARKTIQSPQR